MDAHLLTKEHINKHRKAFEEQQNVPTASVSLK